MTIRRVALIGALGRMGRLFVPRLRALGMEVDELDQPLADFAPETVLPQADVVLLSVPASALIADGGLLAHVAGLLRPDAILADLTSVKCLPLTAMLAAHKGPVVGTHPLFGPVPPENPRTAVIEGRSQEAFEAVFALFERLGFGPFKAQAEEHDRAMALIQGLNFVTTAAYFACSAGDEALTKYVTPSLVRRLDAARKMLVEDGALFTGIFASNPYSPDAVRRFRDHLEPAASGDLAALVEQARWWWRERPPKE